MTLLACSAECTSKVLSGLGMTRVSSDPGVLWRMVALVGLGMLVLSLLQCFRRRLGTAFLAFICGGCLVGLAAGPGRVAGHGQWAQGITHIKIRPMPLLGFEITRSGPDKVSEPGVILQAPEPLVRMEPLSQLMARMGSEFWSLESEELRSLSEDGRAILKRTERYETAGKARLEAYRMAARELRVDLQQLAHEHARWAERKIKRNQGDVEEGLVELLQGIEDSEHVEIITESTSADGTGAFRSAIRVRHPGDIAQGVKEQFFEKAAPLIEKVAPRGRRLAMTGVSLAALGILVFLAYVFVDTGTRGHFTWTLRFLTVTAFVGICTALWYVAR